MNLKKLIKKRNKNIVNQLEQNNLEVTTIIFQSKVDQIYFGQWRGILTCAEIFGRNWYTDIKIKEKLMSYSSVSPEKMNLVLKQLEIFLKSIGVNTKEICLVTETSSDELIYNAYLEKSNKRKKCY